MRRRSTAPLLLLLLWRVLKALMPQETMWCGPRSSYRLMALKEEKRLRKRRLCNTARKICHRHFVGTPVRSHCKNNSSSALQLQQVLIHCFPSPSYVYWSALKCKQGGEATISLALSCVGCSQNAMNEHTTAAKTTRCCFSTYKEQLYNCTGLICLKTVGIYVNTQVIGQSKHFDYFTSIDLLEIGLF